MPAMPLASHSHAAIAVAADPDDATLRDRAAELAALLDLPLASADHAAELLLVVTPDRLELRAPGTPMNPIACEFLTGPAARRQQTTTSRDLLAKAVGFRTPRWRVLDATAGLGRDAVALARLGALVTAVERSPVIAALLDDGLRRANLTDRVHLQPGDAVSLLRELATNPPEQDTPQAIYLDPMFPHREKAALVKKEMRLTRRITGEDPDAPQLLEAALAAGRVLGARVAVKRPRLAPIIPGPKPSLEFRGSAVRFDVYLPANR